MDRQEESVDNKLQPEVKTEEERERKRKSGEFRSGMLIGALIASILLLGIYAGRMAYRFYGAQRAVSASAGESVLDSEVLEKIQFIQNLIQQEYYYEEDVSPEALREGIYRGMVKALGDPYSEYYSKDELEEVMNSNQGVSYGIGAMISINEKMGIAMISGVMEESPALKAGLEEGDLIYEVDGESTQGMSLTQVVSRVKGKEGTTVHLTIYREGEAIELDIERGKLLETATVEYGILEANEEIGYLRIREFDVVTVDQYTEAMAELREYGMKGLVLDLRDNPGGNLNAVVEIARKILPAGLIVYTEDKQGNRKEYTCDGKRELDIPLVVLVNEYSASASEILAGAIQDYNKGTLVGVVTYGKGIVQQIQKMRDGTAVKLTISAYYTPAGRNIHKVGIEPDVVLEYDQEASEEKGIDNQLEKAIEILEGKME